MTNEIDLEFSGGPLDGEVMPISMDWVTGSGVVRMTRQEDNSQHLYGVSHDGTKWYLAYQGRPDEQ